MTGAKQVWGQPAQPVSPEKPADPISDYKGPNNMKETVQAKQAKPKEVSKTKLDEKKEQMKNALFSGISGPNKDSDSDSDDDKKKPEPKREEPKEVDLLDIGGGSAH